MDLNCSKCKVEISQKVFDYSKKNYDKALCRDCQKENKNKPKKEESNGLSKKDSFFTESMIKGRNC